MTEASFTGGSQRYDCGRFPHGFPFSLCRDVKPANFVRSSSTDAKFFIVDFGIAKEVRKSHSRHVCVICLSAELGLMSCSISILKLARCTLKENRLSFEAPRDLLLRRLIRGETRPLWMMCGAHCSCLSTWWRGHFPGVSP